MQPSRFASKDRSGERRGAPAHASSAALCRPERRAWLARARARRQRRGASFVEGLAVVLAMAFLLAVLSWFHSVYRAKGDTLAAARLDAWQRALAGCRMRAAEALSAQASERASIVPKRGAAPDTVVLQTRSVVTCNELPAGAETGLAGALDALGERVPMQPVDMDRWLSGAAEPFAGFAGALDVVGRSLSVAARDVSNARDALAAELGDAAEWTEQRVDGALEWMRSLYR